MTQVNQPQRAGNSGIYSFLAQAGAVASGNPAAAGPAGQAGAALGGANSAPLVQQSQSNFHPVEAPPVPGVQGDSGSSLAQSEAMQRRLAQQNKQRIDQYNSLGVV